MKQIFLIFSAIVFFTIININSFSQENEVPDSTLGWKFNGIGSFTFSQVSFSNWAAGGENSVSLNGLFAVSYDYKAKNLMWDNDLGVAYGFLNQNNTDNRKTDDNLEISSKFSYKAINKWYYSSLVSFKSQFAEGFEYDDVAKTRNKISEFMAPGYLNIAIGMNYAPNKDFSLFIGPLSGKSTFVRDDTLSFYGAYGVEPGETVRYEFGGTLKAAYSKDIFKNVNLISKLELFSNYNENLGNIDVDLQMLITLKVNKFLSTNISMHMIYDDDIKNTNDEGNITGPKLQFKEIFGVGITYKF
ncbi:MAG: DUF3078 domain-containing protein [Bacteroidales bacterium]|nr:DUF3078 domain-containing protein [Bacteroidales bacterium]MBN2757894.1 DUF3078 domain-containing protein [Bacteroidales bacterium]